MFGRVLIGAALAAVSATSVQAASVDLTTWTKEGSGTWVIQPGNDSVIQTQNVDPGVFYSDFQAFGNELGGTIRVNAAADDDYIGFVLGFNPGDATAASTDFLLVDWKQGSQNSGGCTGFAGLAISRVTAGFAGNENDLWCHNNSVQQLQRGFNLGSTGWLDNTEYEFSLEYTATSARVFVNGVLELDVAGSFSNGRFGFYNYSQQAVEYAGITQDVLPGVPEPGTWALLILGFGAIGGAMRRKPAVRAAFG